MAEYWSWNALEELAQDALQRCGARPDVARSVARALIAAEADGQYGHGLRRLESYCPQVKAGKVDGTAEPELTETAGATARVDARCGFAYPALELAVDWLAGRTPSTGVAAAGIFHSHHCGVAGHWMERLAEKGLVGLMFANTPSAMAPAGGTTPLFGTNPIAFAAPRGDGSPVVVDLSLSKVARGKIMAARQKGEAIPEGWAIDKDGQPTTDPAAALAGAMVPIGDAKGAALALMVEVLAAGLTGANFSHQASSFLDARGAPPATGQLLLAFAPGALGGEGFTARMEALCEAVLSQPGTRLPGASRAEGRIAAREKGLPVDDDLIAAIRSL